MDFLGAYSTQGLVKLWYILMVKTFTHMGRSFSLLSETVYKNIYTYSPIMFIIKKIGFLGLYKKELKELLQKVNTG